MFIITRLFNWLKRHIRDQFGFSKTETNGVLLLLGLLFFLLTVPQGIRWYYTQIYTPIPEADLALLDSTLALLKKEQTIKPSLPKRTNPATNTPSNLHKHPDKVKRMVNITPLDINTAVDQQLQTLPGIGPTRSARIIKYRDKLGGFVHPAQYQEIYGLDSLATASMLQYTYISPDFQPKKININQHNFKTLVAHPYLPYEKVQLILRLRNKKGKIKCIEELLQLNIFEKATLEKIKPYLAL